ncbi:BMP family ABC transporter substrate-binding protein [Evansella sp. LMS18]|uniref:BMP family lipoprotein n=1 Tax=Evansella sp. LMS18 TaxID=2924033 RepID=UPI0020D1932A|nr:BMP family ABC transporter substrate-binding protein [Evansella sp. LMS18]UTR09123.1 BMP family ABC transporter substrate-binding protein [Evansella sp. LMS18]
MKKRFMTLLTSVLAAGTLLAACGEGNNNEGDTTPVGGNNNNDNNNNGEEVTQEEDGDFSARMVTDVGGVDDRSFNESAWDGLQEFGADYDVEVDYIQSSDASDYAPNLNRLARDNTSISFAIGFLMEDDIREVAQRHEDLNFAIVDTVVTDDDGNTLPNLANITFAEHEGSFLVGVVAGLQTENDHVGFIGGVESPLIKKFENGFKAGVLSVNPDAEISIQYAQDFNDASRGQQIADTMYGNGADVIYHAAGGTGNGVFTEAIDRARNGENVWVIGVDQDQHAQGQWDDGNVTLTSMVKRVDQAVYQVSEMTMEGNFPGGDILEFGLEDQGVGIAETTDNVEQESLDAVEDYKQQILDGDIEVPQTDEEFEEFEASL